MLAAGMLYAKSLYKNRCEKYMSDSDIPGLPMTYLVPPRMMAHSNTLFLSIITISNQSSYS